MGATVFPRIAPPIVIAIVAAAIGSLFASADAALTGIPEARLQSLVDPPIFDAQLGGYRRRLHSTKDLEVARLVRFAMSVFWRSAIANVSGVQGARLGKKYEELLLLVWTLMLQCVFQNHSQRAVKCLEIIFLNKIVLKYLSYINP